MIMYMDLKCLFLIWIMYKCVMIYIFIKCSDLQDSVKFIWEIKIL